MSAVCIDGRTNVLRPHIVLDDGRNEVCACETEEQAARVVAALNVAEQRCAGNTSLRLVNWWHLGNHSARVLMSIDSLDGAEPHTIRIRLTSPHDKAACLAEVEAAVKQRAKQLNIATP